MVKVTVNTPGANRVSVSGQNSQVVKQVGVESGTALKAFETANLALTIAQTGNATPAFIQANLALATAQSAFTAANTAVTDYSPAFNRANLAFGLAQTSFGQANTGLITAQAAFNAANSAVTDFSPAFNKANLAFGLAQTSFGQANTARDQANTKVSKSGDTMTGDLKFGGGGGILNLPTNQIAITANVDNDTSGFIAQATGVSTVYAYTDVIIQANSGGSPFSQWYFNKEGTITFPDSTSQSTAWTGNISLSGLSDVVTTGSENNEVLVYDSSVSKYVIKELPALNGGTF